MIGNIVEYFVGFLEFLVKALFGVALAFFIMFVVLPVLFVGFFTSAVYAARAVSYWLMIKNETYLRQGWSFTNADVIEEYGMLELCWYTDQRSYKRRFHGVSYDDTIPILYRIKNPKRFIRCDEKYWRGKMRTRCIWAVLWGISFFLLFIHTWL